MLKKFKINYLNFQPKKLGKDKKVKPKLSRIKEIIKRIAGLNKLRQKNTKENQ